MSLVKTLNIYSEQVKQYGLYCCLYRFAYLLCRRTGLLIKRFPTWQWKERPLSYWVKDSCPVDTKEYKRWRCDQGSSFFFNAGQLPRINTEWQRKAVDRADQILLGRLVYFSDKTGELGFPFKWLYNPFTGYQEKNLSHWCKSNSLDEDRGDIKYLWEPARFGWAYTLVRAYNATGDEKYAQAFWTLWQSFCQANPIQMGANWMCGQETSLRALSCIFALYAFWNCQCTTADRVADMSAFLAASCERIQGNIGYARSTKSNHGIGEAIALYTVGTLFGEFKHAARWKKLGKKILEEDAKNFIFSDGSYIQHSMNYHRFMLQIYLWAMVLADNNNDKFSDLTSSRVKKAYRFLYQHQDPSTGKVPNYGSNDGALIFPLNDGDYTDYRGVIGAMHYYFQRDMLYEDGLWQEDIQWFFGADALENKPKSQIERKSCDFKKGGYYTLRGKDSWAMVRCHSYKTRPAQADMLHFDLWFKGINILRDSGSYRYFPHDEWNKYFISTRAHNTIVVAGAEQMEKGPRFMWLHPVKSRFITRDITDSAEIWQGRHHGYKRLPCKALCRRTICRIESDKWVIVDDVLGTGTERTELLWHLPDFDYSRKDNTLTLDTPKGKVFFEFCSSSKLNFEIFKGQVDENIAGWQSLHYGRKTPAITLSISSQSSFPVRFVTLVTLNEDIKTEIKDCKVVSFILKDHTEAAKLKIPPINEMHHKPISISGQNFQGIFE